MADTQDDAAEATGAEGADAGQKKKGGMAGLLVGLGLAIGLGAGAAYAVQSGLLPIPGVTDAPADAEAEKKPDPEELAPAPSFVALDPLTVTIGRDGALRQLRISFSIETSETYAPTVDEHRPRILDAVNTLLRAVDENDLAEPWALERLRAQLLRRIRIATDPTAVQDLLITEYVIF